MRKIAIISDMHLSMIRCILVVMRDMTQTKKAIEDAGGYHTLLHQLNTSFRKEQIESVLDNGGFPVLMTGLLGWCRKNGWDEAAVAFETATTLLP